LQQLRNLWTIVAEVSDQHHSEICPSCALGSLIQRLEKQVQIAVQI